MRVADTSFLYALFSRTDHFHARAREAAADADSIRIPSEIYSETVSLIQNRQGFPAARAAGDWIRSQERIQLATPSCALLDRAWAIFLESHGRLSYPDASVLAWCFERESAPLAFDKALLRHARKGLPRGDRQRS